MDTDSEEQPILTQLSSDEDYYRPIPSNYQYFEQEDDDEDDEEPPRQNLQIRRPVRMHPQGVTFSEYVVPKDKKAQVDEEFERIQDEDMKREKVLDMRKPNTHL